MCKIIQTKKNPSYGGLNRSHTYTSHLHIRKNSPNSDNTVTNIYTRLCNAPHYWLYIFCILVWPYFHSTTSPHVFFQINMIHKFHLGAIVIVRPLWQRGRKVLQEMSWFKDIRQIWLLQIVRIVALRCLRLRNFLFGSCFFVWQHRKVLDTPPSNRWHLW